MSQFLALQKWKLKNSQHFDFIEAFITVLTQAGFAAQRIQTLLALLLERHGVEDSWFKRTRTSEIIARRNEADMRRDDRYARLHRLVNVWAGSGILTLDEAATILKKSFTLYKLDTKSQVNEESGTMTNLANDLSTPENLARIEAIGGTQLFNEMVEANNQVKAIFLEQGAEESEKVLAALQNARKDTDETYDQICAYIEASELTADDPAPYTAFIKLWNGTVKLYQDMLDRKSSSNSSSSSSSQQGGTSQQGGSSSEQGGSEQGGGEGGGTEQGGSEQGGSEQGGGLPPSGGGEVGDDNGGSSENGGGDNGGGLPPSGGGEVGDNSGGGGAVLPGSGGEG